jgi:hypothetical protein
MSRKTERNNKPDAIAEQSLAATLRKLIDGDIALQFPKVDSIGEGEDSVQIINPPLVIKLSRAVPGTNPPLRIAHAIPFQVAELDPSDDKSLAIALAVAYRAFTVYEEEALKALPPDVTGNGRKIIMPGE